MAQKKRITAEDLYRMVTLSDCRLSPDASCVAFVSHTVDKETEKKHSSIWMADSFKGKARRFTYGEQNDSHPRWSPDGKSLAFLSNRKGDNNQIFVLPVSGGEARPVTKVTGHILTFEWMPDGKQFLVSMRNKDKEVIEREKSEKKKKLGVVSRRIKSTAYKFDGVGFLPEEKPHYYMVSLATGNARQITKGEYSESGGCLSPNGKKVCFSSQRIPDADIAEEGGSLFELTLSSGRIRPVKTGFKGGSSNPVYSPDGQKIVFFGARHPGEWWRNQTLYLMNLKSGKPRDLTGPHNIHASAFTINDTAGMGASSPQWSPCGRFVYVYGSRHGRTHLHRIDVTKNSCETVLDPDGVVGDYHLSQDGKVLVWWETDAQTPCRLKIKNLETGREREILRPNTWLDAIDLGTLEETWVKTPGGPKVHGWILKPPGFRKGRRYPSILEIHGGPYTQYGCAFMHEFYYLASKGFVVYFTNPRNSQGYGEKVAHAQGIWGQTTCKDLLSWSDHMAKQPYIDRKRMGVTGGSFGGFMTAWIIGHTHKFAAAVSQRCVFNQISMWGSSDANWHFQFRSQNKPPWENLNRYWDQSPMKYIGNARTPTMVIHSEQDLRCVIEQGEQLFVALRRLGIETEMIRYPDESHGLSRGGRADRKIDRLNHILRWFEIYLK